MIDPDTAEFVLDALAYAVSRIHNGCIVCIEEFVETANEHLARASIPFKFRITDDWEDRVEVVGTRPRVRE